MQPLGSLKNLTVWVVLEGYVIMVCGSIPMLKPLVRWSRPRKYKVPSDSIAAPGGSGSLGRRGGGAGLVMWTDDAAGSVTDGRQPPQDAPSELKDATTRRMSR